ncbi:MAG: hypothetical protein ACERKN_20630 [Velocimicrobium sp.]
MKRILRILLFMFAIAIGGVLGNYLLLDFELYKMCFFGVACIVLGYVFHAVDKKIASL